MKKDKRSTFVKILSEQKGGEDPRGANALFLGEFLGLPFDEMMTDGKRLLSGLLNLDRTRRLFQLNESRRGVPNYYLLQMILRLSDDKIFMEYARRWFKRTHMRISSENYLLWTLFSLVYAQAAHDDEQIDTILQSVVKGNDTFTRILVERGLSYFDSSDHKVALTNLLVAPNTMEQEQILTR